MMNRGMIRFFCLTAGIVLFATPVTHAVSSPPPPAAAADSRAGHAERARLLQGFSSDGVDSLPVLLQALDDERPFVRRTAAHLIVRLGSDANEGTGKLLDNPDFQVRRIAINGIAEQQRLPEFWAKILRDPHPSIRRDARLEIVPRYVDSDTLPQLMSGFEEALRYDDAAVRLDAVLILAGLAEENESVIDLLTVASRDPDEDVSVAAFGVVVTPTMERLQEFVRTRAWQALIDRYGESDFVSWPDQDLARNAFHMRAQAWYALRQGEPARDDLAHSVAISPDRRMLLLKAQNAEQLLDDPQRALELYLEAIDTSVGFGGHLLYSSVLGAVNRLNADQRHDEAIAVLDRAVPDSLSGYWGAVMHEAYGRTLAAQGKRSEAAERYQRALALDGVAESLRSRIQQQLDDLRQGEE